MVPWTARSERDELKRLFSKSTAPLVYVTAFMDRMQSSDSSGTFPGKPRFG